MKLIAYILFIFGSLCEFAGVFVIIDNFRGPELLTGLSWQVGLCLCLLGTANCMGFKFLQMRFFPSQERDQKGS